MSDISIESIATAGAVLAFLFAAAAGITSRRGTQLIVIGLLFWLLPAVSRTSGSWIAGQRGSHERSNARRVGRAESRCGNGLAMYPLIESGKCGERRTTKRSCERCALQMS